MLSSAANRVFVRFSAVLFVLGLLGGCGVEPTLSYAQIARTGLAGYALAGDTSPVHDPSIIRQGRTWYTFSSDWAPSSVTGEALGMRCSEDRATWRRCGSVFTATPAWLKAKVPGLGALWAPDVSYFNGMYHVYYAASTSGSQRSVIALATNVTLDAKDPHYRWVDQGPVLESDTGMDFNAIDPAVLVDTDGRVYMTFGSFWMGIKQLELDPTTGKVKAGATRYDLARRPEVPDDPVEGASLVHQGGYYYLFVSVDDCCNADPTLSTYKEAVGRGTSPHGPFTDMAGTAMLRGGGTVLLQGNETWNAPGGASVYIDAETGEGTMVLHALDLRHGGQTTLWVKHVAWSSGWPELQ